MNLIVNKLDNNASEILIYGYIGDSIDGITASSFVKQLNEVAANSKVITLRINSTGGSIFEGLGIYSAIKNCSVPVHGYIDGVAASMASVIAMACSKLYMGKYAMMMTHKASGFASGSAKSIRNYAQLMEQLEETMAGIYASRTGLTTVEAKTKFLSDSDKWMTAEEALAEKLVDELYESPVGITSPSNTIQEDHELVAFFNKQLLHKNNSMEHKLSAQSLAVLGITAGVTDQAAIDQAIAGLAAKAQKVDELTTQLTAANQKATKAEDDLKALQAAAVAKEVDDLLAEGASQKKVTPAMAKELKASYAENPQGLKALISAMPAQVAVVGSLKKEEEDQLKAEDWDKLDAAGKLEGLKASDPESFKALFKLRFGSDYKA